ncbi:MAG: histidinol dehydrogenase [Candidatus Bathyarchaeia archaeon]
MKILEAWEFEETLLPKIMNRAEINMTVLDKVKKIVADVKAEGDSALIRYTRMFDCPKFEREKLKVSKGEIEGAYRKLEKNEIEALKKAAENIKAFHEKQIGEKEWTTTTSNGVAVGQIVKPLFSVGVYAPGGKAVYPSSVLMCTVPARVVGVERIALCSPPMVDGTVHPSVLVAADIGGANEIYRVGGAQAIAALAYGTETIPKVEKIVGPGNIYVTLAKLLVCWDVAIDLPAGPTELLIIADKSAESSIIAYDLVAQAEHDAKALTLLLTTSESLAYAAQEEVEKLLREFPRENPARQSIETNCFIVIVKDLAEAVRYANMIAPEHLEVLTENPREMLAQIRNAGAVFLGRYSAVAFGDYSAGTNHVLPTGGYAKAFSGLSVRDFVKTINFVECDARGYRNLRDVTATLARLEGLVGHVKSVFAREQPNEKRGNFA